MDKLMKLKQERESRQKGVFCVMDSNEGELELAESLCEDGTLEKVRHRKVSSKHERCSYTVYKEKPRRQRRNANRRGSS